MLAAHPVTMDSTPRAATTAAVRALLVDRAPEPAAGARVRLSVPPTHGRFSLLRVSGPRDAVLDYAAYLLSPGAEVPGPARARTEVVAVEGESEAAELSLVLSRPIYGWS